MTALQCSALIDETSKEDFVVEIKEEYEEVRDEHYDSLNLKKGTKYSLMFNLLLLFFATPKFTQPQKLVCLVSLKGFLHGNVSQSMID